MEVYFEKPDQGLGQTRLKDCEAFIFDDDRLCVFNSDIYIVFCQNAIISCGQMPVIMSAFIDDLLKEIGYFTCLVNQVYKRISITITEE